MAFTVLTWVFAFNAVASLFLGRPWFGALMVVMAGLSFAMAKRRKRILRTAEIKRTFE
jgi:hypothetical protein